MIRAIALFFLASCAALATLPARAADVRAWLDRTTMQMGETVTLNVELSGDTRAAQPDFSALRQDFDLLGTQSSNSISILNGQTSAKLLWAVGLQPKRIGTLTIPALDVAGQRTQPIALTVQPSAATATGHAGDDLYLETTAEPKAPYVQQQVLYTIKLYYAANFTDGGLDDPQIDGVTVHKLGQDMYYTADVNGRHYHVWERHYSLTPDKSGSIVLPALTFHGHVVDPSDINSFFSRGRAVAARSEPIPLDVRARPPASGNDAWLPARSVTLSADGIDANATAHAGEPLTLTLRVNAQGLGFEQLPDLKLPTIEGADVYPDKTTTQNRDDGAWLYGERVRKFAIVPNRPGTLQLPAISLSWWDIAHDREESAEIPAVELHVEAAPGATVQPVIAPSAGAQTKKEDNVPALGSFSAGSAMWRWLALGALALWLVTLGGWLFSAFGRAPKPARTPPGDEASTSVSAQRAALRRQVAAADWPGSAKALLALAKAQGNEVHNLGRLAAVLEDPQQADGVRSLDRACFGSQAVLNVAAALEPLLAGPLRFRPAAAARSSVLPPLYPQTE